MKMNKDPALMEPEEIIKEIRELREGMQRSIERLFTLSRVLYSKARRAEDPVVLMYANSWSRFSGAVGQGLRRTATTDRVLRAAQQREQERKEEEERQRLLEERRRQQAAAQNSYFATPEMEDDLVALYGQEVMDASV